MGWRQFFEIGERMIARSQETHGTNRYHEAPVPKDDLNLLIQSAHGFNLFNVDISLVNHAEVLSVLREANDLIERMHSKKDPLYVSYSPCKGWIVGHHPAYKEGGEHFNYDEGLCHFVQETVKLCVRREQPLMSETMHLEAPVPNA